MTRWEGHVSECPCGKLRYATLLDALRAISRLRADRDFGPLHAYRGRGPECRGVWHLTSRSRRWHRNGKGYVTGHA